MIELPQEFLLIDTPNLISDGSYPITFPMTVLYDAGRYILIDGIERYYMLLNKGEEEEHVVCVNPGKRLNADEIKQLRSHISTMKREKNVKVIR